MVKVGVERCPTIILPSHFLAHGACRQKNYHPALFGNDSLQVAHVVEKVLDPRLSGVDTRSIPIVGKDMAVDGRFFSWLDVFTLNDLACAKVPEINRRVDGGAHPAQLDTLVLGQSHNKFQVFAGLMHFIDDDHIRAVTFDDAGFEVVHRNASCTDDNRALPGKGCCFVFTGHDVVLEILTKVMLADVAQENSLSHTGASDDSERFLEFTDLH
ncbi:hypothetical protein HQ571_01575 [Candidatus Kuenenbacteria bacterium]|nr:hypothetical protein [Candidatus Kuenenbacteria bacterium]